MNKLIAVALGFLFLLCSPAGNARNDVISKAAQVTYNIEESNLVQSGQCSATAIGPHALLTASHCELPTDTITINGADSAILALRRDGNDHTIYFVDRKFDSWATVNETLPDVGDNVFIIGNSAGIDGVLRKGYVAMIKKPEVTESIFSEGKIPVVLVYDINGFMGDSGAGVFNEAGEVQGVLTAAQVEESKQGDQTVSIKFMDGFKLAFTAADLQAAQTFGTDSK